MTWNEQEYDAWWNNLSVQEKYGVYILCLDKERVQEIIDDVWEEETRWLDETGDTFGFDWREKLKQRLGL